MNPIDNFGDNPEEMDTRNWITIAGKIRCYKASINAKNLETSTIPKKIQLVQRAVGNIDDFLGVKTFYMKLETYIVTKFGSKANREEACAIPIEENNESRLQLIMNRGDDKVRR